MIAELADEAATVALGTRLGKAWLGLAAAQAAQVCVQIWLCGDLGAGKTTLCRGLLWGLGHTGAVKSPTYTLVEPYRVAGRDVAHFDLYRLADPEELEFIGIDDYFQTTSLLLVEWPQRGQGVLPPADLVVTLAADAAGGRRAELDPGSSMGRALLAAMAAAEVCP